MRKSLLSMLVKGSLMLGGFFMSHMASAQAPVIYANLLWADKWEKISSANYLQLRVSTHIVLQAPRHQAYYLYTWEQLRKVENYNTALRASDADYDPVTGKVYGCLFESMSTGYMIAEIDYDS